MTALDLTVSGKAASRADALARWTRALCVLFFLSGFPALIYQLTWQRALFRIFGVGIESVTVVVTAFMLGLGFGSLLGGWISKAHRIPLLPLLALIELMTGAFGVVSLRAFDEVGAITVGWPLPAMAVVVLALVLVPTLLMGATLPLLVGHLVQRSGNVGSALGTLYYVNTLGAGAACLVCIMLLFPFLGAQGAIHVAVAMNVAVAVGAIVAHVHNRPATRPPAAALPPLPARRTALLPFRSVLWLAAAGGLVSLSYEIFFFRAVSYATASSATAFAATLSAFLVGLASGARQAGEHCETLSTEESMRRAVRGVMIANLIGLAYLPVLDHLAWLDRGIVGVAMLLAYLVARGWGALLPYLAELGIAADGRAGMRTAKLYLANIAGSALGSVVTGFVLMDDLSLVAISVVLVVAGVICALLLVAAVRLPRWQKVTRVIVATAVLSAAVLLVPRYSSTVLEKLYWKGTAEAKPFTRVIENRSGVIAVDGDGTVFGNGIYDDKFNIDLRHDSNGVVRPYALSLFHPAPRDVMMIGLSSGAWAQIIANNPAVASLTIVEINSGYATLVAQEPQVASVLGNPKVTIITDDGRRWLWRHPERKFDAIVSNTTYPFRANASNLTSTEFLALVRNRLKTGGIFFYNSNDSERVQRTGCLAFPLGARFTNHMVVSGTPIAWDFARWRRILEVYRIDGRAVLDPTRAEDRALLDQLMALEGSIMARTARPRPIEPCPDILARTAGREPVTDDNMGSEWRYFLGLE